MPRSNRPRRGKHSRRLQARDEYEEFDFGALRAGMRHIEVRHGIEWTVQPIRPERALKIYHCPGCGRDITPGVAHVAVWRADSIMGEDAALADRRHWHTPCWQRS